MCRRTAAALAEGKLVGWVQGRAEFGPRALGNRSILADARYADMKDKINSRVKFREEFYRITGVPLILNTSFNVMGKPIIQTVEDALSVFYTSALDLLVIGNTMIETR